jgi:hypothetical protein
MRNWIWRIGFLCFGLAVGWQVYQREILPSGPFHWDEAAHSLKGLLIAYDLQSHDWLSFLYDTYRQVYWPPLHSWFLSIAFLVHAPTVATARAISLILFLLGGFVIYCAALQLPARYREVSASIATTLFLTSPLILSLAGQAMLEVPGVFFICLTIFVFASLMFNTSGLELRLPAPISSGRTTAFCCCWYGRPRSSPAAASRP